jgi:hypothetical protein
MNKYEFIGWLLFSAIGIVISEHLNLPGNLSFIMGFIFGCLGLTLGLLYSTKY